MKDLAKKLRKLLKNNNLIDIVIFGSIAKGSLNYNDIDLALISEGNLDKNKLKKQIKESIKKDIDFHILSINDYYKFIWITLIKEGYSVKYDRYLSDIQKIKPVILYKYSLKDLTNSKKVMFERAIKNFKDITKLSNRVVLVPINKSAEFSDFLKNWDIDIDTEEYGLLPLVRKQES